MTGVLVDESGIRERWLVVEQELDERGRRMWAAAEARSHGWGGIEAVVRATGISEATVRRGIAEVESGERAPALPAALESLIDPVTPNPRARTARHHTPPVAKAKPDRSTRIPRQHAGFVTSQPKTSV